MNINKYKEKLLKEKEKLTIKNAGHAKASEIDPETYWTTVSNFINKYINQ